jgi:hypothetical protein
MQPNIEAFSIRRRLRSPMSFSTGRPGPVQLPLGYDSKSGRTNTSFTDKLIEFLKNRCLAVDWILEMHVHTDYVTSVAQRGCEISVNRPWCNK